MNRRIPVVLIVAAIALFLSGCGTLSNCCWLFPEEGGKRVYGGVRGDCEIAWQAVTDTDSPGGERRDILLKLILDLPLSAVADTITLPYTVPYSFWWALHSKQPDRAKVQSTPSGITSTPDNSPVDP